MKFNLYSSSKSNRYVSCAVWITNELVATCGDDRRLIFWNTLAHNEPIKVCPLPMDAFPTTMHYHGSPQSAAFTNAKESLILISNNMKADFGSNPLALGATNGCFYLIPINWNGNKLDRVVEAHKGAIIVIRWSNDNSTLATAGEDGLVKIWSKVGMLRSTIVVSNVIPVYAMSWSPDSNSLAYVNNSKLIIKSLSPQSKALEWNAHDGLIISLHWSQINGHILTASEDGRVKMWDSTGRLIYLSSNHSSALTSVAWSFDGDLFTVSTFNSLELHDHLGYTLSVEKLSMEGVSLVCWAPDIHQVCCVCSSGRVLFAHVVDRVLESKFWQVSNLSRRTMKVSHTINDFQEVLEFKDPIIRFSFQFDHLIVATKSQCFIYRMDNLATPHYFDLKPNDPALMIKQCHRHFALLNLALANLYGYDGRFIKTIKLFNMRPEALRSNYISLNDYTLAYKDSLNSQTIHLIDLERPKSSLDTGGGGGGQSSSSSSQQSSPDVYRHQLEVINIKLNTEHRGNVGGVGGGSKQQQRTTTSAQQLCAFLDRNSDLYILSWNQMKTVARAFKLSTMIKDICWHVDYNLLVSLHENRKNLSIWLYPNTVFLDSSLAQDVIITVENQDISSTCKLVEFCQNRITIERQDRVKIYITVNPFVILLHKHKLEMRLDEAVRMCNFLDKSIAEIEPMERNVRDSLWATLAVMSLEQKQFRIAEVAYAAINKLDKVLYLNRIKSLPSTEIIQAELELLCGNFDLAQNLLLQKGYVLRALQINLQLQRWLKALELAEKFNQRFAGFTVDTGNHPAHLNGDHDDNDDDGGDARPSKVNIDLIHLVLSCREHYLKQRSKEESLEPFKSLANTIDYNVVDWNLIQDKFQQNSFVYQKI